MRLKVLTLTGALLLLFATAFLPGAVLSGVKQADYLRAGIQVWAQETSCTGVVEQPVRKQVFLSTPVIADSVLVSVGDQVEEGEVLATIDTGMTKDVLSQSVMVKKEASTQQETPDLGEVEKVASLYGISVSQLIPLLGGGEASQAIEAVYEAPQTVAVPQMLLSPMNGTVTDVAMQSDVLTQATGPVFTIADSSRFTVRAQVSENQIGGIEPGDEALISGPAFGGQEYHGVVESVAPTAKRTQTALSEQATVDVVISVLDPDERLKSGCSATAEIISQHAQELLTLPYEAINQDEENHEYVLVYQGGRAEKRVVTTGQELSDSVQITAGLGEQEVVLLPQEPLSEGRAVRLGEEVVRD